MSRRASNSLTRHVGNPAPCEFFLRTKLMHDNVLCHALFMDRYYGRTGSQVSRGLGSLRVRLEKHLVKVAGDRLPRAHVSHYNSR